MMRTLDDIMRLAREGAELDLSREDPAAANALLVTLLERLPTLDREIASTLIDGLWRWGACANALGRPRREFLCAVVDDAGQPQQARYDAALLLLTDGDDEALRSLAARARVGTVPPDVGARALLAMDPAEGFDELVVCYRADAEWRRRIASLLRADADARWLDEAIAVASADPENAAATLAALGSERAREELQQWIDAAGETPDTRARTARAALIRMRDGEP